MSLQSFHIAIRGQDLKLSDLMEPLQCNIWLCGELNLEIILSDYD